MQILPSLENISEVTEDPNRKIPNAHLTNICKKGHGKDACRYISLGPNGFVCAKDSIISKQLDLLSDNGSMKAVGNNCEGLK